MVIELVGAAQTPQTLPWKKGITRKSVSEAETFAETHGAVFPDDVRYVVAALNLNTYAAYATGIHTFADELWSWQDFLNDDEEIVLRLRADVLESDEAIVGVFSHEAFELTELRKVLPDGQALPAQRVFRLIAPGIPGNLHCQAWDIADTNVRAMR
jgi:hypothetical protein